MNQKEFKRIYGILRCEAKRGQLGKMAAVFYNDGFYSLYRKYEAVRRVIDRRQAFEQLAMGKSERAECRKYAKLGYQRDFKEIIRDNTWYFCL